MSAFDQTSVSVDMLINSIVLGETGVGKHAFIQSFMGEAGIGQSKFLEVHDKIV
jgi:hypothetical protein